MTPQTQFTFDGQGVVLANRKDVVCRDVHPDYVNLVISAPSLYTALQALLPIVEGSTQGHLALKASRPTMAQAEIIASIKAAREALDLGSSTSAQQEPKKDCLSRDI